MSRYSDIALGQNGSGNDLLLDSTKPLPEPLLNYLPLMEYRGMHLAAIEPKCPWINSVTWIRKIRFRNHCCVSQGPMSWYVRLCSTIIHITISACLGEGHIFKHSKYNMNVYIMQYLWIWYTVVHIWQGMVITMELSRYGPRQWLDPPPERLTSVCGWCWWKTPQRKKTEK